MENTSHLSKNGFNCWKLRILHVTSFTSIFLSVSIPESPFHLFRDLLWPSLLSWNKANEWMVIYLHSRQSIFAQQRTGKCSTQWYEIYLVTGRKWNVFSVTVMGLRMGTVCNSDDELMHIPLSISRYFHKLDPIWCYKQGTTLIFKRLCFSVLIYLLIK